MKKILFCLAAFAALVSCTKENPVMDSDETTAFEGETIEVGFLAYAPGSESETPESKSVLASNGYSVLWEDGDEVVLFTKGSNNEVTGKLTTSLSSATSQCWFSGYIEMGSETNTTLKSNPCYLFYPSSIEKGYIDTYNARYKYTLETNQEAKENGSFGAYNLSASYIPKYSLLTDKKAIAEFVNGCALIKISFPVDVNKVEITSSNSTPLTGTASLKCITQVQSKIDLDGNGYVNTNDCVYRPTVDSFITEKPSVTLTAPDGLKSGVTYNIVVWPGTHSSGLTFTFTNEEGKTCVKSISQEVVLKASEYDTFNFTSSFEFKEPPYLNISSTSLTADAIGQNLTFDITSNAGWTVSGEDWMTFSPASGTGNATVTVTVAANNSASTRNGNARITLEDGSVKTIEVSQEPMTYKVSGSYLTYASELTDGLYVIANKYDSGLFWTESNGQLIMSSHSTTDAFHCVNVFEYIQDNSKINISGNRVDFDDYRSWSAGKWRSLSTGKYLDENFGLNAESDGAVYLISVNNWGGNEGGELQGYDVYNSTTTQSAKLALWYDNNAFAFGDMNYAFTDSNSVGKRKYYVYKVERQ